jgi:hypothetical protein
MRNRLPGEKQRQEAKLGRLRAAIDAGDASGVAEGDVFAQVRQALQLSTQPHQRMLSETRAIEDEDAGQ